MAMDETLRKAVERRAFALWEVGRPEGCALLYWLRAELELEVIRKGEAGDPFAMLHELAVASRQDEGALGALQRLLDKGIARSGATSFLGGDRMARSALPKRKGGLRLARDPCGGGDQAAPPGIEGRFHQQRMASS
jgi:Protein of unknown function (DUF2934)